MIVTDGLFLENVCTFFSQMVPSVSPPKRCQLSPNDRRLVVIGSSHHATGLRLYVQNCEDIHEAKFSKGLKVNTLYFHYKFAVSVDKFCRCTPMYPVTIKVEKFCRKVP